MASISERIETDLTAAMKNGDSLVRDTMRMLKTAIKNKEVEKMGKLSDEEVVAVLRKEAKSRQEAIDQYRSAGRTEQAAKETKEKQLIEQYLPALLSDEELEKIIVETIKTVGATSVGDLGKVMGAMMPKVQGKADGSKVSALARQHLS